MAHAAVKVEPPKNGINRFGSLIAVAGGIIALFFVAWMVLASYTNTLKNDAKIVALEARMIHLEGMVESNRIIREAKQSDDSPK